ncbi:two-component system chemotaxis response regulator CheB [Novosphingobium sp. SG751A]|uniref:chemotaxis protein CheB n=1 Tax=Novosphingobium sp. SG751A TaxID=2587000 RepID=UPI0015518A92|nr:chemotaxis protein CheB [Novosphingobium sp. SG751A]NOW47557.1 two-component system chemotaxis response regulator CheB [Novosphingobium sp. SG751A]
MNDARVLVVDDSAAMRALFSDVLEQQRNVTVIGTAANADEARDQIAQLKPNVVTLDVEMPGMSGIEFLEEIMATNPLPVVMLSSLTQSGTETSLKAYALGAVECFPKPLKATPEQFAKTVGKLGKIVLAAANSNVKAQKPSHRESRHSEVQFTWNGHYLAMATSMGGIDALTQMLGDFPAECPPTVIVLQSEPALVDTFINRMAGELKCKIAMAKDGATLTPGMIHIAADPEKHVVFEPGSPPRLRMVQRDPVDGARPSATLLFGTMARAGVPSVGAILTGMGGDGAKGLRLLRDAGSRTFVEDPATATVGETPAAAVAANAAEKILSLDELSVALVASCNQG